MIHLSRRLVFALTLVLALPIGLIADTLVLRNGSRIEGELVSIRDGVIEFEERRGSGRGRIIRVDREEVARIEFDTARSYSDRDFTGRGRPSGLRERQVIVAANVGWNDTGIEVRPGQSLYFEATGEVRWGRDRRDGPEGENNSPSNPNRPLPNRPAAALIGRVGNSTDYFFIGGETGAVRMRTGGRLFLGVNDDFLSDNTGNFRVVVYY